MAQISPMTSQDKPEHLLRMPPCPFPQTFPSVLSFLLPCVPFLNRCSARVRAAAAVHHRCGLRANLRRCHFALPDGFHHRQSPLTADRCRRDPNGIPWRRSTGWLRLWPWRTSPGLVVRENRLDTQRPVDSRPHLSTAIGEDDLMAKFLKNSTSSIKVWQCKWHTVIHIRLATRNSSCALI